MHVPWQGGKGLQCCAPQNVLHVRTYAQSMGGGQGQEDKENGDPRAITERETEQKGPTLTMRPEAKRVEYVRGQR